MTKNVCTTKTDINIIAINLTYPYISFWYAYYLGFTEQILDAVQIATKKTIEFENYRIKFIAIKYFFGYRKI